jgi:hypothetical protein
MSSNLYFPSNKYDCMLFTRESAKKINDTTYGLVINSEFYMHLTNNTFENVKCVLMIDGKVINTYSIDRQSTIKVVNYMEQNQFFKFRPTYKDSKKNILFSEITLEWIHNKSNKSKTILTLIATEEKFDVINVREYFVYNEPRLDIPSRQLLDKLI